MSELTCKELVELVTEYLDGAMPAAERGRFEAHLATCEACTTYLDQMKTTIAVSGQLREEALPEDAKRDLLEAFRRWKKP